MSMFLWSTIEGLFGVEANSLKKEVIVHPQFPKDWAWAKMDNIHVGKSRINLRFDLHRKEIEAENLGEENIMIKLDGKVIEFDTENRIKHSFTSC